MEPEKKSANQDVSVLSALARTGSHDASSSSRGSTQFGPYALTESIGRGGFGEVFLGVHRTTWKKVAVKVLGNRHRHDPKARARFDLEIKIGKELKHPHILPVSDDGEIDGIRYFVTPYVDGKDLLHQLERKPLRVAEAVRLIRQVADAVSFAHRSGYLHRDIKPGNILIETATGHPFVADFGLAKELRGGTLNTDAMAILGTQPYMSPEQIDPHLGDLSAATDIYAIGVTLYQTLTGRTPFPRRYRLHRDLLTQIAWDRPLPPSRFVKTLHADLDLICAVCLQKSPHDRYDTAEELSADLQLYIAGKPIRARLPGFAKRVLRYGQRHPIGTAGIAISMCIATVALAWAQLNAADALNKTTKLVEAEKLTLAAKKSETEAHTRETIAQASERAQAYVTDLREVPILWERQQFDRVRTVLDKYDAPSKRDLRNIEWYYWNARVRFYPVIISPSFLVAKLAVSPDGKSVAVVGNGRLAVLDAITGNELFQTSIATTQHSDGREAEADEQAVAFDASGSFVAACCHFKSGSSYLGVWECASGTRKQSVENEGIRGDALVFSPDGQSIIATGDSFAWGSWLIESGAPQARGIVESSGDLQDFRERGRTCHLCFADGSRLVVSDEESCCLWQWPDARTAGDTTGEFHRVGGLPWMINGQFSMVKCNPVLQDTNMTSCSIDVLSRSGFSTPYEFREFAITQGRVAARCTDGVVRVWRFDEQFHVGGFPLQLLGTPEDCRRVEVGGLTIAAYGKGTIALWRVPLHSQTAGAAAESLSADIWEFASPSGRYLAGPNFRMEELQVCSTADGSVAARIPLGIGTPLECVFSPDDRHVILRINNCAPSLPVFRTDRARPPRLELWNLDGPRLVYSIEEPGPYPPDGSGAIDSVRSVAYMVSGEGPIRCVSLATGEVETISVPFLATGITVSPTGQLLGVAGDRCGIYDLKKEQWLWISSVPSLRVVFHRAEKYVLVQTKTDRRGILAFETKTGTAWPTLFDTENHTQLLLSADSSRLYSLATNRLRVYSLDENPGTVLIDTTELTLPENVKMDSLVVRELERQLTEIP